VCAEIAARRVPEASTPTTVVDAVERIEAREGGGREETWLAY
jgi:hypothetical protein